MKLKLDDAGHVVVSDGKPVYVDKDGKDVAFDVVHTVETISRLNGEAKGHRERAEAVEGKLKTFDGIDPAAARKALETVANLDSKKLIDAGEKDAAIAAAVKPFEEKLAAADKRTGELEGALTREIKGGAFARSKFAEEKVAVPRHMLERTYGDHFKVEDGKLVPYDAAGNKLYSRAKPGEIAEFDEALELLISADPYKDHILKGSNQSGGGAKPGAGGGGTGQKTMTRGEFNKLSPADQMKSINVDKIQVVDAAA